MQGIRFVTDEQGKKVGVLIDLAVHGELWEDFYDHLLMNERANEPEESLEVVRGRLKAQGKQRG
jgi:hypothetical protein